MKKYNIRKGTTNNMHNINTNKNKFRDGPKSLKCLSQDFFVIILCADTSKA